MNANAPVMDNAQPPNQVAEAMDRVLSFERAAQAQVSECERACASVLEQSRQQARAILERVQTRIVVVHTRAAKALEQRAAELTAGRMKSAAVRAGHLSDPGRRAAAVERLAARLTTTEDRPGDGN